MTTIRKKGGAVLMADRILIVDDDKAVLKMLYKVVTSNGLDADTAESGEEALRLLERKDYALLLLDINLKGIDGFEVIEKIRNAGDKVPVIIVSGRKEDFDTVYGLNVGADDYITKPFNPVTLGAKIKALIRRSRSSDPDEKNIIKVGPFTFNASTLRLYKNSAEIFLTGKEIAIMKLFMDNVDRIFSKDMIYDLVWGNAIVDDNAIMVYINRLRQKIEDDPEHPEYIRNVRGIGYRFVVPEK